MTQRHPIQNNATMLITSVTANRKKYFKDPSMALEASWQIYRVQEQIPFFLYAFVIMPDHVHFLMKVLEPGKIADVLRTYKMGLSFQTGISPLWQRRYDARTAHDPEKARGYIHRNPVNAGIVESPEQYPWSSACGKWDVSPLILY